VRWDILDAFRDAREQAGISAIPDFNTGDNEGSCVFHVNQKRGRRWSAARGFLKPVLAGRTCGSRPVLVEGSCSTASARRRALAAGRRAIARAVAAR
jgi:choline dehydrogenase-like flavoprotein